VNIFFDVDQTILGMDNSLRPGVRETMTGLKELGHDVYMWSGMGIRRETVRRHGLECYVSGLYQKPLYDYMERLEELGLPFAPDFVIDDDPQIVSAFGGIWVPPYYKQGDDDGAMKRVLAAATAFSVDGHSDDAHFRARGDLRPLVRT
jgi:hypothetical protein